MEKHLLNIVEDVVLYRLQKHTAPGRLTSGSIIALVISSTLLLLTGCGLILFGLFQYLRIEYSPHVAFISTGVVMLFLTTTLLLVISNILTAQERKLEKLGQHVTQNIEKLLTDTADQFFQAVEDTPEAAITLAAASGLMMGQKIR